MIPVSKRLRGVADFDLEGRLEAWSRADLKKVIKENDLNVRVLKSMSDDDVREAIFTVARTDAKEPRGATVTNDLAVRTSDLSRSRPPRWAWERRFALAYLSLLIGPEEIGKSTLIAWAIAQWTKGGLHGDLHRKRVHVGILGDEDSFDDLWTPRLHAAGADLTRVHLIERKDGDYVDLERDRGNLKLEVERRCIRVLFLDALLDNLPQSVDANDQKSVRAALRPFRTFARQQEIAVIGSLHPNKKASTFRQLVAGSVAFNAVSRSSMLLTEDPNDPDRRVLCRGKGNLSVAPKSRSFAIESVKFKANGEEFDVGRACDFQYSPWRIKDLMEATDNTRVQPESKQGSCRALISQLLPRDGEWHPCAPLYEACREADLSDKIINRAKLDLSVQHRSVGSPPVVEWKW